MTREETKKCIKVMQAYVDGKEIEVINPDNEKDNWQITRNPVWSWARVNYRIKPQQISIPATEEELEIIGRGVLWCRNKKNPNRMGWIRHNDTLNESDWLFFNPDTKCWEDWSEK